MEKSERELVVDMISEFPGMAGAPDKPNSGRSGEEKRDTLVLDPQVVS